MKKLLAALLISGLLMTLSIGIKAQSNREPLKLILEKSAIIPTEFYMHSVSDERAVPEYIGSLFASENGKPIAHATALQGGSFESIRNFLKNGIPGNTSLRPLNIQIKQCDIKETISGENRVSGEVSLVLMFDLDKEGGSVPLSLYKSTAKYTRSLNNISIVEPTLRKLLGNSLNFINNWMNAEAPRNPQLAKSLKFSFRDYAEQHDDTVYYDHSRPLNWDDFREKRSDGKFAAAVFPSFGYDQRTQVIDGIINIELVVKVFVIKSASWVSPGVRSSYNLKHEQKHFELVKLVAERFKKKLLSEKLTPDNYQGIINFEYLEFYREMNKIQREYDEQTSHGAIAAIQEFWNRKIDAELKVGER